jgi:hypothetical protein
MVPFVCSLFLFGQPKLYRLYIFRYINCESSSEKDRRFLDIIVLVTAHSNLVSLLPSTFALQIYSTRGVVSVPVFIPQCSHATSLKQKRWSVLKALAAPTQGKGSEDMAVGHD